jgi:hypothetical protein
VCVWVCGCVCVCVCGCLFVCLFVCVCVVCVCVCVIALMAYTRVSLCITQVIESSLGKPIDEMFVWLSPTPIASGSVGQVHHATLRPEYALADGSCDVAVKVIPPLFASNVHQCHNHKHGCRIDLQMCSTC